MWQINKDAFQDSRNALLTVRILSRLQDERSNNEWLNEVLNDEESKNGYSQPVPLINQASFLAMLYSTALWLRESYFKNQQAVKILKKHIKPFITRSDITITYGGSATHFSEDHPEQFSRRLRNALGHASLVITSDEFQFKDTNKKKYGDWVCIHMPWIVVGEYAMALISAGNEILYAQQASGQDAGKLRQ